MTSELDFRTRVVAHLPTPRPRRRELVLVAPCVWLRRNEELRAITRLLEQLPREVLQ